MSGFASGCRLIVLFSLCWFAVLGPVAPFNDFKYNVGLNSDRIPTFAQRQRQSITNNKHCKHYGPPKSEHAYKYTITEKYLYAAYQYERQLSKSHRCWGRKSLKHFPQAARNSREYGYKYGYSHTSPLFLKESDFGATLSLAIPSLLGFQLDRWFPNSGGGGILGSMLAASIITKTLPNKWILSTHPFYDLCWTFFLPASLTLMLLAPSSPIPSSSSLPSSIPTSFQANTSNDDKIESPAVLSPTLSSATSTNQSKNMNNENNISPDASFASVSSCIQRVSGPYLLASIGSMLGCWMAFHASNNLFGFVNNLGDSWLSKVLSPFAFAGIEHGVTTTMTITAQCGTSATTTSNLQLARWAAGCVTASYIGGSVNCFATAKIIGAPPEFLSALAAADLFTMAIYFSGLSASLNWKFLRRQFHPKSNLAAAIAVNNKSKDNNNSHSSENNKTSTPRLNMKWLVFAIRRFFWAETVSSSVKTRGNPIDPNHSDIKNDNYSSQDTKIDKNKMKNPQENFESNRGEEEGMKQLATKRVAGTGMLFFRNKANKLSVFCSLLFRNVAKELQSAIPLLGITIAIVRMANRVERYISNQRWGIPGTACAIIAIVAPWFQSLVKSQTWWGPIGKLTRPLANLCFLSFFASIGATTASTDHFQGHGARPSSYFSMGPACLFFTLLSVAIHFIFTVSMSLLLFKNDDAKMGVDKNGKIRLEMEDVWIASNAAIGGPTTAAAFCQRMDYGGVDKNSNAAAALLKGRTIAATVWGVVGYAIGTMIGVGMYKFLGGQLPALASAKV